MNRLCLAGILIATAALSQPPRPSFEVSTIKPAAPNQNGYGINWVRGLVRLNNVTLKAARIYAYRLHRLSAFRRTEMGGFGRVRHCGKGRIA
jgi:hypothetical protein